MIEQAIKAARPAWLACILNPYLWLALIVWTALVACYAHEVGSESGRDAERALWLNQEGARKDATITAVVADSTSRAKQQDHQNQTNVKVSTKHEAEVQTNRNEYRADRAAADRTGGLRIAIPATVCNHPAATTEGADAFEPDESAATTVRLPREVENDLWSAAEEADALSAQIRAMQEWVRANGHYGTEQPEPEPAL